MVKNLSVGLPKHCADRRLHDRWISFQRLFSNSGTKQPLFSPAKEDWYALKGPYLTFMASCITTSKVLTSPNTYRGFLLLVILLTPSSCWALSGRVISSGSLDNISSPSIAATRRTSDCLLSFGCRSNTTSSTQTDLARQANPGRVWLTRVD